MKKTYPEIRQLRDAEILWHYHHAVRRKNDDLDEKNSTLEFFMQIVNPSMWKEYQKVKESTVHEVASYKENMTEDEFLQITRMAESRLSDINKPPSDMPIPPPRPPAPAPAAGDNHPVFNAKDPSTWTRPANIPQMRQVTDSPEDVTYTNPVSIE